MMPPDNTPAELEAFAFVCQRLAGFAPHLDPEWVDGYLTALASGPVRVPIDDWLPRLCGDAFERAFADPEDEARGRAALQARLSMLCRQLDPEALFDDPDALRLTPYLLEAAPAEADADAPAPAEPPPGTWWADGFLAAQQDYGDEWIPSDVVEEDGVVLSELLSMVHALRMEEASEPLRQHLARYFPNGDPTRDDLVAEAAIAVQDLRAWWVDHAPRPQPRQVQHQPGRNDPCPCGSGKKFKRCHG